MAIVSKNAGKQNSQKHNNKGRSLNKKGSLKKETAKNDSISLAGNKENVSSIKKGNSKKAGIKKASSIKQPVSEANVIIEEKKPGIAKKILNTLSESFLSKTVRVNLMLRFHTKPGQLLFITAAHEIFGNLEVDKALPMEYFNEDYWTVSVNLNPNEIPENGLVYNYLLRNEDGSFTYDWGNDKKLERAVLQKEFAIIFDSWNHAGFYQNVYFTEPFKTVLLKREYTTHTVSENRHITHTFRAKAPLLLHDEVLCLTGSDEVFGNWNEENVLVLNKKETEDYYALSIDLSKVNFPLVYKYGVYNTSQKKFVKYEDGNNRFLFDTFAKNKISIVNDGFANLSHTVWKGAGVAIPVFSLRSDNSCGIGEFLDLKLLADWAVKTGLKVIQILPVNDTTATKTWSDSYPYAAISAFALHPVYVNLDTLVGNGNFQLIKEIQAKKDLLNQTGATEYVEALNFKWDIINKVYPEQKVKVFESEDYKQFYEQNKQWLLPYATFCYFRDTYGTADFNQWPKRGIYNEAEAQSLLELDEQRFDALAIHFFVQYHLHLQLKDATTYAHNNGVIVKGDIPIGIYRFGVDAWQDPSLYHMNMQAGAPPDDFAVKGQNWGFPTYNWEVMKKDNFNWWKNRFAQMSCYFDAFRIDHILGFFRIWNVPVSQVEGIMGFFTPSIPVHINEFHERNIWFDYDRYCKPFITEHILWDAFRENMLQAKEIFFDADHESYSLKPEFKTQQQVLAYFNEKEENEVNLQLKQGLFNIISNVILFEVDGSTGTAFHFRFSMENTSSFQHLENNTRNGLKSLYVNYFFQRQDDFWKKEAMQKLPSLKRATNMLICGEDLGLVPSSVPHVMNDLGILSLEIQRMPKDSSVEFFSPQNAPYLSVVTPSTHDMSTVRGWWEENRERTQRFYNNELHQWGQAPYFCEDWISRNIVMQHLYSPAMWSIFLLQDLLAINAELRSNDPAVERINDPSDSNNLWKYRMHLKLEDLLNKSDFNNDLKQNIAASGR